MNLNSIELDRFEVNLMDLASFKPSKSFLTKSLRALSCNPQKNNNYGNTIDKPFTFGYSIQKLIGFKLASRMLNILENLYFGHTNFENFFEVLRPDIVILDNRNHQSFPASNKIFEKIFSSDATKIVTPHAPHYIDPYFAFSHVNPVGKEIYSDCDVWLPFRYSKPHLKHPNLSNQFFYSGYPGLDSDWLRYCKKQIKPKKTRVQCLYIARKFFSKNTKRQGASDFVTMEFSEVLKDLKNIRDAFLQMGVEFELQFKPHPSGRRDLVEQLLEEASLSHFSINLEPVYRNLSAVDVVVSPYSTAVLIPAMTGIPTVVINTDIQKKINSHWDKVCEMYQGLVFFIERESLNPTLGQILQEGKKSFENKDINHLRNYFPDGSISRCITRLLKLRNN